ELMDVALRHRRQRPGRPHRTGDARLRLRAVGGGEHRERDGKGLQEDLLWPTGSHARGESVNRDRTGPEEARRMASSFETVTWKDGKVVLIDQLRLPAEEVYQAYDTPEGVAEAIRSMVVRGAPAIGVTAALGVALAAHRSNAPTTAALL